MNQVEFIKIIKSEVTDSGTRGIIKNLLNPPGQKPSDKLLKMSKFYNSLDQEAQSSLNEVIFESVNEGVFGFLCIIDGVRSINESQDDKGDIRLFYADINGEQVPLNGSSQDFLHDIYNTDI